MKNKSIIRLIKNIWNDIPAFVTTAIILIAFIIAGYFVGKAGPLDLQEVFDGYPYGQDWIMDMILTLLCGFFQISIVFVFSIAVIGSIYLLYRAFIFMAIEIQVCKLPDDYFSSHEDITAEELYKLLEPFHFHGNIMNMPPKIFQENLPVIERIMSKYTKEQLLVIESSPASEYNDFHEILNDMIRERTEKQ